MLSEEFLSTSSVLLVSFLRVCSTFVFENTCPVGKQLGEDRTPLHSLSLLEALTSSKEWCCSYLPLWIIPDWSNTHDTQ